MLDGNIQVFAYLVLRFDCGNQFLRNLFGIAVQNPYPVDAGNFRQFVKQEGQAFFAV